MDSSYGGYYLDETPRFPREIPLIIQVYLPTVFPLACILLEFLPNSADCVDCVV